MSFIDLHCHWIAGIDDGCRVPEAGIALLRGLQGVGFSMVIATPHMRPGMFENDRALLTEAYDAMRGPLDEARADKPLPEVHLSSEHFFDDTVFERIRKGEACPYPDLGGAEVLGSGPKTRRKRGVLVEFNPERFPQSAHNRFFDLHRAGFYPVIAHPERYAPVWKDTASLTPLVEAGAHLLLDVCSLVGKYGRAAQKASEKLLDEGAYAAACSDAHKPEDVDVVAQAIERLRKLAGDEGVEELLTIGPRRILHLPELTPLA
jgi:protein-tyrosine phosphatase